MVPRLFGGVNKGCTMLYETCVLFGTEPWLSCRTCFSRIILGVQKNYHWVQTMKSNAFDFHFYRQLLYLLFSSFAFKLDLLTTIVWIYFVDIWDISWYVPIKYNAPLNAIGFWCEVQGNKRIFFLLLLCQGDESVDLHLSYAFAYHLNRLQR